MRFVPLLALSYLAFYALPVPAQPPQSWRAARGGVEIKVSPLSRSAALAFYQARGFSAQAIVPYAQACGFAFELRNGSAATLALRLAEWEALGDRDRTRFRLPGDWDAQWARQAVAEPARIAFRWAQFPTEQEFAPGDWIMGMGTLQRRLEGSFRLIVRYRDTKQLHEIALDNVSCAALD